MHISARQTRDLEDQSAPDAVQPSATPSQRGGRVVWAGAGALLASAVWGGSLLLPIGASDGPDVRYRMSNDLCADAEMTALGGLWDRGDDSTHEEHRHRAMDVAQCNDSLVTNDTAQQLTIRLQLHKVTSPRAEFEANGEANETNTGPKIVKTPVEGIGERAYFGVIDYGGPGAVVVLTVLDGGAEFSFNLNAYAEQTPQKLKPLMIKDMRALMVNLAV
ncbi:hypothetical protein ABZY45_31925 [Streptomyces sp. NPDC006516]|uniref:hypothetical protein n=1 Tax=Streptomyces sp. NPDC006516 TaxID=3154309 RepID=UPI0033BC4414